LTRRHVNDVDVLKSINKNQLKSIPKNVREGGYGLYYLLIAFGGEVSTATGVVSGSLVPSGKHSVSTSQTFVELEWRTGTRPMCSHPVHGHGGPVQAELCGGVVSRLLSIQPLQNPRSLHCIEERGQELLA
jgi:hypothetical protein